MKVELKCSSDFIGSTIGSCRHCGAPVLRDDRREVLGHREPTCRKFFANAEDALSYEHAVHSNFSLQPAVQQ